MSLNSAVFELPPDYGKLEPGRHFRLADILPPKRRRIFNIIVDAGCCSATHVAKAAKISKSSASTELSAINGDCAAKGFPPAFLMSTTRPTAWCPNPAFTELLSIPVPKFHGTIEDSFNATDQKIINCVVCHTAARASQIAEAAGLAVDKVDYYMKKIERRCKELDLPSPFVRTNTGARTRYSATADFRSMFKLQNAEEQLEDYFTKIQITIIKAIAETPYISVKELSEQTSLSEIAIYHHLEAIKIKCKSKELPKLKVLQVGSSNEIISRWSKEFLRRFNLKEGPVDVAKVLRGNQLAVYTYWQGREVIYASLAAKELGMTTAHISAARIMVNKKLRKFRKQALKSLFRGKSVHDWVSVRSAVLEKRRDLGRWPRLVDFKGKALPVRNGIVYYCGGLRKVLSRVTSTLTDEEIKAILEADLKKLKKSNGRNGTHDTAQLVASAYAAGMSPQAILKVLDQSGLDELFSLIHVFRYTAVQIGSPMGASSFTTLTMSVE